MRPIHKARNLGCFTSSAQATPRSQIDDQPLPQPVSITARVRFDFNCFSNMFSTSLTVQLLFVISDLSSRFYFKHNNYNTLNECPSLYYNQRNVCPNPMLVSKMTPISCICNLKITRDMGRKGGCVLYTKLRSIHLFNGLNKGCVLYTGASYTRENTVCSLNSQNIWSELWVEF